MTLGGHNAGQFTFSTSSKSEEAHPHTIASAGNPQERSRFAGIDLRREPVPDATSLPRFRHLLKQHQLGERLFTEAGRVLQASGMTLKTGPIGAVRSCLLSLYRAQSGAGRDGPYYC